MGIIAWIALGMAAALLPNMLLPAKDHGAYFHARPPGRNPPTSTAHTKENLYETKNF